MSDKNKLLVRDAVEMLAQWVSIVPMDDLPFFLHHPRVDRLGHLLADALGDAFHHGWEDARTMTACVRLKHQALGLLALACWKGGSPHPAPTQTDAADVGVEWRIEQLAACLANEVREMVDTIPDRCALCPPTWVPAEDPWQFAPEVK